MEDPVNDAVSSSPREPSSLTYGQALFGNTDNQVGEVVVKERGKSIEIGEGVERPLDG